MNEDLEKNLNEINKLPGLKKVKEEVKNLQRKSKLCANCTKN